MARDEGARGQVLDEGTIGAGRGREVEAGQGLVFIAAGQGQSLGQPLLTAAFQFVVQQQR